MIDGKAIVDRWGLWGVGLVCLLSATLLPGVSEVGLAALAAGGFFRPWRLIAFASVGNWLGGVVTFGMGWALGLGAWIESFGISAESVAAAREWFGAVGTWGGLLVWLPVIGDPLAAVLGMAHSPVAWTLALMIAGKALRYIVIVFASDGASRAIKKALRAKSNDKDQTKECTTI